MQSTVNSHRHYFVCQTIVKVAPTTLLEYTKADFIYALESGEGHVLVLQYNPENGKKHSTVENSVAELDRFLMARRGSASTSFVSIGEYRSCKVKSFSREDRVNDPDFRKLFDVSAPKVNREYVRQSGVVIWDRALLDEERRVADAAREAEDIRVQRQVMEADPEAFGGNSFMGPGSKMLNPVSSVMDSADGGTDAAFEENEDNQSRDPKSNGKKRAASDDGLDLKRSRISRGGAGSVEGCMLEELREKLDKCTAENEELKKELSAANASVKQLTDPFSIRIPLLNRMKDFVCVTHVAIDVEKLDESIVAFVEKAVDQEVPRVIVTETVDNYGNRRVERDLLHDEFSVQRKKLEAGGGGAQAEAEESISKLRRLKTLTELEKEEVEASLKMSKQKIQEMEMELKTEKGKVFQFLSDSVSMKARIKELELQVNVLRSQPGLVNGTHMAPIPVAPSVDVNTLSDELTKMRRELVVAKTSYRLSQEKLAKVNEKIAEYEAETPSDQLKQVSEEKRNGFKRMEELFQYLDDVVQRPSAYRVNPGTMNGAVSEKVQAIVLAMMPGITPKDKMERVGRVAPAVRRLLEKALETKWDGF